ncbi:hypothetical protein [Flavobacterium aurantiibacter]|uniref:Cytochrome c domain-containing protein n=1 Tax=Flavobacterium aurantiibacter TaxID=2023067 RepID=A0A255ZZC2_9FLAO|nr:hypothetical protein [Flavobacterium aurantiibacter]OYQ46762.1 hypothetical protein CHX27_04050 [Flavobacterium aurantiibacter]
MRKYYPWLIICIIGLAIFIASCSGEDKDEYVPVDPESPVNVDLSTVPYAKLSDYKFFEGDMKLQIPALGVLPYEPISQLFTDYAHKKRFIWMPKGVKATYNGDGKVLEFPTGAVIIKTFYYDNVQPSNTTRIMETRLLIKKEGGWIFAEYIWNDEQTEATLTTEGGTKDVTFVNEYGNLKNVNYRFPSNSACLTCHKIQDSAIPIGPKPQNLNSSYAYADGTKNQLAKWVEMGYLDSNYPAEINTVVDWKDTSKPLETRVRSYIDINCAHCHQEGSHCSYRPMRFAFSESTSNTNLGVCMTPQDPLNDGTSAIISPGRTARSALFSRLNTAEESIRMPLLGRTIVHDEAVQMIQEWINSLPNCN